MSWFFLNIKQVVLLLFFFFFLFMLMVAENIVQPLTDEQCQA